MKHGSSVHLGPSRLKGESPATGRKKKPGTASSGDVLLWRWFGLTAWIYNQVGPGSVVEISSLNSDFLIWILTIGLKND